MTSLRRFVTSDGLATCLIDGAPVSIPVFAGVLKHITTTHFASYSRILPWCASTPGKDSGACRGSRCASSRATG